MGEVKVYSLTVKIYGSCKSLYDRLLNCNTPVTLSFRVKPFVKLRAGSVEESLRNFQREASVSCRACKGCLQGGRLADTVIVIDSDGALLCGRIVVCQTRVGLGRSLNLYKVISVQQWLLQPLIFSLPLRRWIC